MTRRLAWRLPTCAQRAASVLTEAPKDMIFADSPRRQVRNEFRPPSAILSDRGSIFVSQALRALYKAFGIEIVPSTAFHHNTIGLLERWHSTLKTLQFRTCIKKSHH